MHEQADTSLQLRQAANAGNLAKVKQILAAKIGFDINAKSSNGNTALIWAALALDQSLKEKSRNEVKIEQYITIIQLLLEHGADDSWANHYIVLAMQIIIRLLQKSAALLLNLNLKIFMLNPLSLILWL